MADDAVTWCGLRSPDRPAAHTLTLEFGRFLSEREWRDLILQVRRLPYVKRFRVDAVPVVPRRA